jgi:hypothetical protein
MPNKLKKKQIKVEIFKNNSKVQFGENLLQYEFTDAELKD